MTTDPQPDAEPELTDVQKAYNVAQSGLFHLAAYGHFRYWPTGHALPGTEDDARRKGYCARINMAREHLEAAVLRLVAEHAETFCGDWGIVAAWLRSLADDPAELSLLAVRPDERPATVASAAVPSAPADRAAMLSEAERTMLTYALNQAQLRMWATGKFTDEDQAAVVSLRRMADEAQQPETVPEQVSLTRGQLAALLAHHADVLAAQWRAVAPGAGAWEVAAALSLTSHANELTDDEETPAVAELLDSILTFRDEPAAVSQPGKEPTQ